MKPLEELSPEEIQDILIVQRGDIIFYTSEVSQLTETYMMYNQKQYDFTTTDAYLAFKEAKEKYEYYKFFNAKEAIDALINDTLKEKVENKYVEHMENIVNKYSESVERITKRINDDNDGLGVLATKLKDNFHHFNSKISEINQLADNIISDRTKKAIDKMLHDVSDATKHAKTQLSKTHEEFDDVVSKLKTLF